MKKCFIIAMCLCSILAFARSPHHGWHRHHRGGDGVWLAAGITGIVAKSINILNAVTTPRYVAPIRTAPVVTTPPAVQPVTVTQHCYPGQYVPVTHTVMVPVYINGQLYYRQEQKIVYVKQRY
jgi:hypothetical protein